MPGADIRRTRWLARLPHLLSLLSLRTISGKLIVGLIVLFGAASAVVSLITAQSLSDSVMSNLNGQLQAATTTWSSCVAMAHHDYADQDGLPDPGDYAPCATQGQPPGTFEAVLTSSGAISFKDYVTKSCTLSAADKATLTDLPTAASYGPSRPSGPSDPSDPSGSGASPAGDHDGDAPAAAAVTAPTHTRTLFGVRFLLTKVPGPDHTKVVTGLPMTTVDDTLNSVETTEHILFAVALGLAVLLGAALVQFSLRPLRRVAATATRVTELPLDSGEVTLPDGVPDTDPRTEVGQVGAAFNRMLQHVQRALGRRAASEARLRRFAADASHELRTPLSAIRGYAELGLRHQGPVPEDVMHALRRVQSESARMSVLVDDLMLLARLDAGRPLEREPVDLSRLAIDATSDARVARPEHHWRLDLPEDPICACGDEHRLHQVLANLMSNAGKHTPPGSTVSVALRTDEPPDLPAGQDAGMLDRGVRPARPRAELSITDDGPGIPPELLPELFERFTRADTSRARDLDAAGKSTGLGLAIVDAVVAAHGGSITVTSRPGRTRFTIYLPLC